MKHVTRYQSKLLFRRSYKPNRIRIKPSMKLKFVFRPVRFGVKPQIKTYECDTTRTALNKTSSGVAKVRRSSRFPVL